MKINVISDTHNDHLELDQSSIECDVLIHCGDFGTKGNYQEAETFLYWFVKQPAKFKILVPGNHDKRFKTHPDLLKLAYDLGIKTLMNESVDIKGYLFYGAHYVPWFINNVPQDDLQVRIDAWSGIPKDTSVLVTHAPPRRILDRNKKGECCGCDQLLVKVNEIRPVYHVFGHIHEFAGKERTLGGVKFLNCCNKDETNLTTRTRPVTFHLPDLGI